MSLITVWSPLPSGSGSTILAACLPAMLCTAYPSSCLLLHGGALGDRVEAGLLPYNQLEGFRTEEEDCGMRALQRMYLSGRLDSRNIKDYTASLIPGKLDLIRGDQDGESGSYGAIQLLQYSGILTAALGSYDVVIADAGNGLPNALDMELISRSDLLIIGLNQNLHALDQCFKDQIPAVVKHVKQYCFVTGKYDSSSHASLQNMKRRYGVKSWAGTIPYCTEIQDAWNSRNMLAAMLRSGGVIRRSRTPFGEAVTAIAAHVAKQLGLPGAAAEGKGA